MEFIGEIKEKERGNMPEEKNGIVYIGTEHIHPHPENPRKELGELKELAESLKKNGVMQNLTVIPIDGQPGEYYALIGNRRHGAAKLAGLKELPCRIVEGMSQKEQLSTMLEENMQRNDLTIYEQAQGFQLMLDLGETEDSIAEKTGFSKTTIRHRLNIAKLDQKELQKKGQDEGFQLTLKDLYELEKVEDVAIRNKILREARDSREIVWRSQNAAAQAKRDKIQKQIVEMLKKEGVGAAPEKAENELYTGKWETIKEYDIDKEVPKQLRLPKGEEKLYYLIPGYGRDIKVIKRASKKEESPEDKKRKEKEKKKKQINAIVKEMRVRKKEFIRNIIAGKIEPVKETAEVQEELWRSLMGMGTYISRSSARGFFTGKRDYECTQEERDAAEKRVMELGVLHQMMLVLDYGIENIGDVYDWQGKCNKERCKLIADAFKPLERYGWIFEDDELRVLEGTHELYAKESEEKNGED